MDLSRYSAARPLLLWTDFPPDEGGGGGAILKSLISPSDRAKIVWVSPMAKEATNGSARVVPLGRGSMRRTSRRSLLLDSTVFAGALAGETLRIADTVRARAIWILLHGAGVPVGARLVAEAKVPVHVTVHDDPGFGVALRSRRYLALTPLLERQLGATLRGARSADVVSAEMAERYRDRFGVSAVVVHRAVETSVSPAPPYDAARGLRVAQLGNMYAYEQLPVLGRAIALAAKALGVKGRLTLVAQVFGERLRAELARAGVDIDVELIGYLDERAAAEIMRETFTLYLSYAFSLRQATFRRTSFPTKLSTYIAAARPIVAHAPPDSSLASLAADDGYVRLWTTMQPEDGAALLTRMWRDTASHASKHAAAEALRRRFFDPEKNASMLRSVLDGMVTPLA